MKIINQVSLLFITTTLLIACANQIREESRIEQTYRYSSALYIAYKKNDGSGENAVNGEIKFSKNSIEVSGVPSNENTSLSEYFSIKTVTYDKNPNEIKYRTNKGDFTVKLSNDTITEVTFFAGEFLTIFKKAKDIEFVSLPLPAPIAEPAKGWKRIEIDELGTIDLPPIMEIQAGKYKEQNDKGREKLQEAWKKDFGNAKLIMQPKGINVFDQDALKKYARVIVETTIGSDGEFSKLSHKLNLSEKEMNELNQSYRMQIQQSMTGTPIKLVAWNPVESVEINNMPALKASYKRQLKQEPNVVVNLYRFQNDDRIHSLTISYRETEEDYWKKTVEEVLQSFRITNVKE